MNFVELVLTVCTLAQPVACDEQKLVFSSESGSLHGCMMQAQALYRAMVGRSSGVARGALALRSSGLGRR